MFLNKLKWAAIVLAGLALVGAGVTWGVQHSGDHGALAGVPRDVGEKGAADAAKEPDPADWKFPDVDDKNHPLYHARRGVVVAVDATQRPVLARMEKTDIDAPFAVDPKAGMSFTAPVGARSSFDQKMSFTDLCKGMVLQDVERSEDGRTFVLFSCAWPPLDGNVKAVRKEKRTLTVENVSLQKNLDAGVFRGQTDFSLAREATVTVDGPNLRQFLLERGDVPVGRAVALELEMDRSVRLVALDAGGDVRGVVRSADGAKGTILVAIKGKNTVELALEVKRDAAIRLAGKSVTLGELKKDMPVLLRLDADRRAVVGLWAAPVEERK